MCFDMSVAMTLFGETERDKKFEGQREWSSLCSRTYHVDHHLPDRLALLLGEVHKDVALRVLQYLEGDGQVVVLEHGLVVVHERELRAAVDEVLVREAGMVCVVDGGREQGREDLERREHGLQKHHIFALEMHRVKMAMWIGKPRG